MEKVAPLSSQRFVFCTLRDFKIDVGETLRIYGIVNALSAAGYEVVLLSNARDYSAFHPSVKQVFIGAPFHGKRILQALASALPARVVTYLFPSLFNSLTKALQQVGIKEEPLFFFDYLDNTIGYLLAQTGAVGGYINDVHGVATIEFLSNQAKAKSIFGKTLARIKHRAAHHLDRKVFGNAAGFLWGSKSMQSYFERRYSLSQKKSVILPYLLDALALQKMPSKERTATLKTQLGLTREAFVFMFVGTYKATAGVEDLITAFHRLAGEHPQCRLVLIGSGAQRPQCEAAAAGGAGARKISFLEPVPYADLPAHYALAQVIVCPDQDNAFSQYVVHIKYLDALSTGRLVLNGAFKSVLEINDSFPLSPLFEPSNGADLYRAMEELVTQYSALKVKYAGTAVHIKNHFTYVAHTAYLVALRKAIGKPTA